MGPGVDRQHRWPKGLLLACGPDAPDARVITLIGGSHQVIIVDVLVDDCPPASRFLGGVHPGFQGHRIGQLKRGGILHRYLRTAAIEQKRAAEFSRGTPDRAPDRARIAVARNVGHRSARALVERVRGDQADRHGLSCRRVASGRSDFDARP